MEADAGGTAGESVRRLLIRADGAARGNPGPASAGAVLIDADRPDALHPDATPVAVVARPLGTQTNNVAEYTAVLLALREAERLGAEEVELVLDSKLVVEQLAGRWKVRHPGIAPLHADVASRLGSFRRWRARHEPRAQNRAADALANLALDDPAAAAAAERRGRGDATVAAGTSTGEGRSRATAPHASVPFEPPGASGWPPDWKQRLAGVDCPMCSDRGVGETEHGIRICEGETADGYLQRMAWQPGYSTVIWKGRHVAEPTELEPEEAAAYWRDVLRVAAAVQGLYRPVKLNLLMLGNQVPHLHTHVLPRYADDPAPGRPLPFPTGEPAAQEEELLRRQVDALRDRLDEDGTADDR